MVNNMSNVYPNFIMMVGLPASGKSTYAKEFAEKYNINTHSSDKIREELSGEELYNDLQLLHKADVNAH